MSDIITVIADMAEQMTAVIEKAIDNGVTMEQLHEALGGAPSEATACIDCPVCAAELPIATTIDLKAVFAHAREHQAAA